LTKQKKDHRDFFASLTEEERMLIELRDELYDGSWESMLQDLDDRLKGRPYIFKLVNRIQDDIARIRRLRRYERTHHVNLSDLGG
jgi:hypothetical protein